MLIKNQLAKLYFELHAHENKLQMMYIFNQHTLILVQPASWQNAHLLLATDQETYLIV